MRVLVFGYNRQEPPLADLTFDCRELDNPDRHQRLKQLTGRHPEIQQYVRRSPGFDAFWSVLTTKVFSRGAEVVVALGCAFGKHRSRALAHMLADLASTEWGWEVEPIEPYVFRDGRAEV